MTFAVFMGVSGSGKTTIARGVAERLGWELLEGDSFHPPANVEKMSHGVPLTDDDRWPWLRAIAAEVDRLRAEGRSAAVACSALKRAYRDLLLGGHPDGILVYLEGSPELIGQRMQARKGHFMPSKLLESQFATLEPPVPDENPVTVSVAPAPDAIIDAVVHRLRRRMHAEPAA